MTDKQIITDPIAHAARLLRETAEELRQAHTLSSDRNNWIGEPEAKAKYDEHMAAAQALEDWEAAVGAGGVQALSAVPAGWKLVPAGWKLVPVEPTNDMQKAADEWAAKGFDWPKAVYRAMLAASPTPPAEQQARWVERFMTAAPQQEAQEPTEISEAIERMAADRYKVVPSHESMFHRWAVVAGNGEQQLYLGREVECQNMARKFAGAFLDGAFVAMQSTAPQPAPATQQAGDVVAYLDVGASGYLDLGAALSEDALQQLPKGRHALVIAGTYGIDGYVAAPQPSPTTKPAPQQEAQEPVAWLVTWVGGGHNYVQAHASELPAVDQGRRMAGTVTPLYTAPQPAPAPLIARSLAEWHEQDGNVAWWAWNGREWAGEPAWIGTPNCEDWPGYHTHWTPHPEQPVCAALAAQGGK